jgi:hypothetical protein
MLSCNALTLPVALIMRSALEEFMSRSENHVTGRWIWKAANLEAARCEVTDH